MRRIGAGLAVGVLIAFGPSFVAASPAHAENTYYGCLADGKYLFGSYPVNHDQDVFTCEWSPYYRYWKYSSTCAEGTHPEATLTPTNLEGLYIAQTRCVANTGP